MALQIMTAKAFYNFTVTRADKARESQFLFQNVQK